MSNPNQSYFEKYIDPQVKEIDRVNVYEFENGMDYELVQLGGKIDHENIKKAQAKVLKNLKSDPAFYTNQLAAESVKLVGNWAGGGKSGKYSNKQESENVKSEVSGKKPETETVDKDNQMSTLKKNDKSSVKKDSKIKPNYSTKVKEMTNTPKKGPGIKKTMDMPGRERTISLKEALSDNYVPLKDRPVPSDAEINKEFSDRWPGFKKSMGDQIKGDKKVKLTQEMKKSIVDMIKETVAMVTTKAGTKAVNYKDPAELNSLKADSNVTGIETSAGQKLK